MPIRIPTNAEPQLRNAFNDVDQALRALENAEDRIRELERKVNSLQAQIDSTDRRPGFITQGDTIINGDLRVEGSLDVRGDVDAPQILDGVVVATPAETGGASAAQRVVEVHGSLAVTGALSAETIRCRNLIYTGTLTTP